VEHAIEIAYRALDENPGKRIFLLSEMIHNPEVNEDLLANGIQFLMDTHGQTLIPFEHLNPSDVVIVPAFGTTLEIQNQLHLLGINPYQYDTTCPFVEKVWNRSAEIADKKFTTIIHGKPSHEETRATFSHAKAKGPALVVKDIKQTALLATYIKREKDFSFFYEDFKNQYSENFNPETDLIRLGVVNQTTMLATETQEIADFLKQTLIDYFGLEQIKEHFADTRDTLCYATNDNQSAVLELIKTKADFAIVAGGYNSSNTSHLVELCEQKLPTYFIRNQSCILSKKEIKHFDSQLKQEKTTNNYLPEHQTHILLLSGASCPDLVLEEIIQKLLSYYPEAQAIETVLDQFISQ